MALWVTEIFYSIQGESLWAGLPCVFIRLSGCNLRCRYCDTTYAYEPGERMALNDIVDRASRLGCTRVTITGGEPLHQDETPILVSLLIENGFEVSMETNGSYHIDRLDPRCIKVVDVKCPSSGMQEHNLMENLGLLNPRDQVKFVIADKKDFDFAKSISRRLSSEVEVERILFSPVHGVLPPEELAQWMLESKNCGRLQLQLHKLLWPNRDRGV